MPFCKSVYASGALESINEKEFRVPDILLGDSRIGINYDGAVHLDLGSIVNAAIEVDETPINSSRKKCSPGPFEKCVRKWLTTSGATVS